MPATFKFDGDNLVIEYEDGNKIVANPNDEVIGFMYDSFGHRWDFKWYVPKSRKYYLKRFFIRLYWKIRRYMESIYGDVHSNL